MKNLFLVVLTCASTFSFAGDITMFTCKSGTHSGKVVKLQFCVEEDSQQVVDCRSEEAYGGHVVLKKTTPTIKGDMIEKIKIPTDFFYFSWEEESSNLEFAGDFGKLELNYVGGEMPGGSMNIDLQGIKHSFKVVGCQLN